MNKLIERIQKLRIEINILNSNRNINRDKYNNIITEMNNSFENIQDKRNNLNELLLHLRELKDRKILKVCGVITIISMVSVLSIICNGITNNIFLILLVEALVLCSSFIGGYWIAATVLDKIIENYLTKKDDTIKLVHANIISLTKEIENIECTYMDMKIVRDSIKQLLDSIENKLNVKKTELYNLEETYFDNINKNLTVNDENKTFNIHTAKKKVRAFDKVNY